MSSFAIMSPIKTKSTESKHGSTAKYTTAGEIFNI